MKAFFLHILQVAGALGLLAGIVVFSLLLYTSEFGKGEMAPAPVETAVVNEAATPPPMDSRPVSLRWVQWIFGAPTPQAPSQTP